MANSFGDLFSDNQNLLPDDLEGQILSNVSGMKTAGSMLNHFLPNAFRTAARLLSGDNRPDPHGPGNHLSDNDADDIPYWRIPPGRSR
jgi:hypothetical protein